jgi:hypothetical protein
LKCMFSNFSSNSVFNNLFGFVSGQSNWWCTQLSLHMTIEQPNPIEEILQVQKWCSDVVSSTVACSHEKLSNRSGAWSAQMLVLTWCSTVACLHEKLSNQT